LLDAARVGNVTGLTKYGSDQVNKRVIAGVVAAALVLVAGGALVRLLLS
jgi:hypothetical protein